MKKVRKLTPSILKRIISEEKRKLRSSKSKRKKLTESKKKTTTASDIKKLKMLKARQRRLINEFKKAFIERKKIKKRLIKGL